MLEIEQIRTRIESSIGPTRKITPIERRFSSEEKYEVTTDRSIYLLEFSPIKSFIRKKEEFELMKELYAIGVQCNKPIAIFKDDKLGKVYSILSFLPGYDARDNIAELSSAIQYEMGFHAGQDLKRITSLRSETNTWKQRKWQKHENYLKEYFAQDFRFRDDEKVIGFIENNYDRLESSTDFFQHDDFHLGNIIINDKNYVGVIDFNNYDWGDPLHEFIKLEWLTWPICEEFSRGQVEEYFGKNKIDDDDCLLISVYIAMSIPSTIVWTLKFHPQTMTYIEKRLYSILDHYDYFENINPDWAK